MATIVFSSIGGAVGGPIGRNIGAFVGRSVDAALFGGSAGGARLRELDVTLSSYGQPLPRHYGRMRVAGSVIWATELEEHIESGGLLGGSGGYSYTANFAVALASRPLVSLGRIWADGKLLRGAAGDLKVGGTLRLHAGGEGQQPDPLIVAHEGEDQSPAFRGLAYVVFEQLELVSFGNRIPSLTFEVFADAVCDLGRPALELFGGADIAGNERGACDGFSVEDTLADTLAAIAPVVPVSVDGAAERPRIAYLPAISFRTGSKYSRNLRGFSLMGKCPLSRISMNFAPLMRSASLRVSAGPVAKSYSPVRRYNGHLRVSIRSTYGSASYSTE